MAVGDIVKITSYIVGRENIRPYVAVHRDEVGEHLPPWTLVLVAGLGSPSLSGGSRSRRRALAPRYPA